MDDIITTFLLTSRRTRPKWVDLQLNVHNIIAIDLVEKLYRGQCSISNEIGVEQLMVKQVTSGEKLLNFVLFYFSNSMK